MRIGVVLPVLHWQGGSQVGVTLAETWAELGNDVEILVLDPAWTPMVARPVPSVPTTFLAATNWPSAVKRLRGRLAEREFDVVHAIGDYASMILGLASLRLKPRPPLLIGSEHFPTSVKFGDFTHFKGRVAGVLMRYAYQHLDASICVNKDLQERLVTELGWDSKRCPVIHNPVRLDPANPDEIETERRTRRENGQPFLIAAAAALQPRKDYPTLLRAFAFASKQLPMRLAIAGEGDELVKLQTLCFELDITDQVEFLGAVSNIADFFRQADVFVFSSINEAFGLVLIEALSQGVPTVSTDGPGPSEIIAKATYGRLVPVGDFRAMAKGIVEFCQSPPEARVIVERAKDFAPEKLSSAYVSFFRSQLASTSDR